MGVTELQTGGLFNLSNVDCSKFELSLLDHPHQA